ncbi:hypothetical protein ACFO3I_00650 [Rheinheimera marina]|uniref:DUF2244 domain-containing protein n=1 Tax=Rheinheimera marina TaxID=1774958 RepID=A0ABV9JGT3_9GAMM
MKMQSQRDVRWPNQTMTFTSVKQGWRVLSGAGRTVICSLFALYVAMIFLNSSKLNSLLMLSNIPVFGLMLLHYLHSRGHPRFEEVSLTEELRLDNGQVCIGNYVFPDTVRKLVIGRQDINGPGFLQLAWNGGEQWLFPVEEIPSVRHFFRQHAPHIQVINE